MNELQSVADLKPWEGNPRTISPESAKALARCMEEFGDLSTICFNVRTGRLVCGHQRRQQLPANAPVVKTEDHTDRVGTVGYGYAEVGGVRWPVRFVDWDEIREKAANVAANSPLLAGEFTSDLLPMLDEIKEQLPDLHEQLRLGDLAEYAPEPEVQGGQTDPDAVPGPPDEAVSRWGEIYQLGTHRLMCGDSGSQADLDTLLAGAQIHLVNTDPPYNVKVEPRSNNAIAAGLSSFEGLKHHQRFDLERGKVLRRSRLQETVAALDAKGHHHAAMKLAGGSRPGLLNRVTKKMRPKDRPLENDFVSDEASEKMLHAWFGNIARVLLPGGNFYIWGGYANIGNYPPVLKACGLYFSQSIIWVKEHPVLTRKDFMGNHEWAFYGWREGAGHKFYGPNNVPDVWPIKKVNPQSMIHLTEKPVELAVRAIQYSSLPGENVLGRPVAPVVRPQPVQVHPVGADGVDGAGVGPQLPQKSFDGVRQLHGRPSILVAHIRHHEGIRARGMQGQRYGNRADPQGQIPVQI